MGHRVLIFFILYNYRLGHVWYMRFSNILTAIVSILFNSFRMVPKPVTTNVTSSTFSVRFHMLDPFLPLLCPFLGYIDLPNMYDLLSPSKSASFNFKTATVVFYNDKYSAFPFYRSCSTCILSMCLSLLLTIVSSSLETSWVPTYEVSS